MDRSVPKPPHRSYEDAEPVKVGYLRFPEFGPSALKKKGILGKAGNYLSQEAKPELCLLMKLPQLEYGETKFGGVMNEQKFIWTWDEETSWAVESFLKKRAPGMCRHTLANADKKDRIKNSHLGVCHRTECNDTLDVVDLLPVYLKKSMSRQERNKMYLKLLEDFPPTKEIVLFDPSMPRLRNRKFVVEGIQKRTLRNILNSNGKVFWVFQIMYYTNSKLEEVKNVLRPLGLQAMRNNTERGNIKKVVASDDKDGLIEWWKAISSHVEGNTSKDFQQDFLECNSFGDMVKGLTSSNDEKAKTKMFHEKNYSMVKGEGREAIETVFQTSLSTERLMNLLLSTKASDQKKVLDNYMFSFTEDGVDKLNVQTDIENKDGKVGTKYGLNHQRMLLQVLTKDKLEESLPGLPQSIANLSFMKSLSFIGHIFLTTMKKEVKRYFDVEKSFSLGSENKKEFFVSYTPSGDSSAKGKMENNSSANKASFDQILLHVQSKASKNSLKLSNGSTLNMETFNDSWETHATEITNIAVSRNLATHYDNKSTDACLKNLVSFIYEGQRDAAILAIIDCVQKLTASVLTCALDANQLKECIYYPVELLKTVLKSATNCLVIRYGVKCYFNLLITCKGKSAMNATLEKYLFDSYLELVEVVFEQNKFTNIGLVELREALSNFENFAEGSYGNSGIECCFKLMLLAHTHERVFTYDRNSMKLLDENLDLVYRLCLEKAIPIKYLLMEQDKLLKKSKETNEDVDVPFVLLVEAKQLLEKEKWEVTEALLVQYQKRVVKYSVKNDTVTIDSDTVPRTIMASSQGLLRECKSCLRHFGIDFAPPATDVESFAAPNRVILSNFKPRTAEDLLERLKVTRDIQGADIFLRDALRTLQGAKEFLADMKQDARTEIKVCMKAVPNKLFGDDLLKKMPGVGQKWGDKFVNNLGKGLAIFEKS